MSYLDLWHTIRMDDLHRQSINQINELAFSLYRWETFSNVSFDGFDWNIINTFLKVCQLMTHKLKY